MPSRAARCRCYHACMFAVVRPVMLPEKPATPALVLRMLAVAMPVKVTPAASAGLPSREATCGVRSAPRCQRRRRGRSRYRQH